jgi:hypothetical protein
VSGPALVVPDLADLAGSGERFRSRRMHLHQEMGPSEVLRAYR